MKISNEYNKAYPKMTKMIFTPIIYPTLGGWLQMVTSPTSGVTNSRGVTGGVYKARERIHRIMEKKKKPS